MVKLCNHIAQEFVWSCALQINIYTVALEAFVCIRCKAAPLISKSCWAAVSFSQLNKSESTSYQSVQIFEETEILEKTEYWFPSFLSISVQTFEAGWNIMVTALFSPRLAMPSHYLKTRVGAVGPDCCYLKPSRNLLHENYSSYWLRRILSFQFTLAKHLISRIAC
jgi:hypothetical protein